MKNLLYAFVFCLSYSGIAQNAAFVKPNLPVQVKATFESEYPGIKGNTWTLDKKQLHTTTFIQGNGKECRIWIDERGILVRVREEIEKTDLPKLVLESSDKRISPNMKTINYLKFTRIHSTMFKTTKKIVYLQKQSDDKHTWTNKFNEKGKYTGREKSRKFRAAF